ncbi:discs, large (Drosophila) homolog-associated protein 2b [Anguilla rostrata]|uniref:discs, large (Drosophila) homolog-associated protein 2b n=1 Tax=Anguilla rostrata TaxID=7938 RepID=UPI0030D04C42
MEGRWMFAWAVVRRSLVTCSECSGTKWLPSITQVLPRILQTYCCILPDTNTDQLYSWSPSPHFDEDSHSPPPRNMKGLSGGRAQHHLPAGHTCSLAECEHSHDHHIHHDTRHSYLLSPTESCPMDYHHRYSPRSSIHSDCMMMPVGMPGGSGGGGGGGGGADHVSSSTFPRMHYSSQYYDTATRDDCAAAAAAVSVSAAAVSTSASSHHVSSKSNRIPANLLEQFEKQLPLHRDGFHTLQYQRASATAAAAAAEQRSESPGRIRHLVHSVQKLFTKSHSLEGSSKMNGTKGEGGGGGGGHHHHGHGHHSKHGSKRSKSKERKHRSGVGGWWSSDDNLDSDSTYRTPSVMSRHHPDHAGHCYPESMQSHHFGDLTLKTSKSNNDVKCSACEGLAMAPEGKFMKRSSWSTLTVSQAKEAYRKSSLNLEKPMMHQDLKPSLRPCHYLQVPQDEWGGYPGIDRDEEIPCRRMRSSSYVKAMGDDESGESDTSPKTSPQKTIRPDALALKSVMHRPHIDPPSQSYHLQTARDMRPHSSVTLDPATNFNPPQFRSRNQSYMRAVSTLSQASCISQVSETEINGQFESVCESVFSEVESQAMDALDLPGCFRTRSHSYLRAIQAGYSQDDDCIPSMTSSTVTSTLRSTTEGYDMLEGTSLLNDDNLEEDDAESSLAYHELDRLQMDDVTRSQHSTSSTVTAVSVPPASPRAYRVPVTSAPAPDPPVPQAIQAFKESANMVAAFNMQWKDEISAMRYELAELRRDVCGELKTFNSNFFNFTQCYSTWSLRRDAGAGEGDPGGPADRVSVGTQAGTSGPVRQNTVDRAVMCQPDPSPSPIAMLDLMDPPRIEITEDAGTPEGTVGSDSPSSSRPSEDSTWDTRKRRARRRSGGRRSASLELWSRKYTSGPMSYLSLSF